MATSPSTTPFFTASPPFPSTATYPPPITYPNPIQIHGGYYPLPPYLAGYGSAPPTFPEPPPALGSTPPQPPPSYPYVASYPHPLPVYAPVPASPTPILHHPPPPPALDPYPSRFELYSIPKPACSAFTNPTPPAFSSTASSTSSVSPAPAYDAVQFSPPPPAGRMATAPLRRQIPTTPSTTLPSIPTSKVTSGGAPADCTLMELHACEVRSMAENSRAWCKGGKSDEQSDIVFHRATPDFMCQGSTTEENGSATPRNDCVSKTKKSGSDLLARRSLLDIQARLDKQLAHDQISFDTIQGQLAKLTSMVSQLAISLGTQSTLANASEQEQSQHISIISAPPAHVAPQVFGEMPTPRYCPRTYGSTLNYYHGQGTPTQSSCVQGGSTNLSEQNLDIMPQSYDFSNLTRQSIILADGTQHYPLEQAVPEPVFDVYDDESDGCSNEFVQVFPGTPEQMSAVDGEKSEGNSTEFVDVFVNTPGQQKNEESQCDENILWGKSVGQSAAGHPISFFPWDPGAAAILVTPLNPASVAAQVAHLTPVLCPKVDITAGPESLLVPNLKLSSNVQDASQVFKETAVYDTDENDASADRRCLYRSIDIIEAIAKEVEVKIDSDKPIFCHERPTVDTVSVFRLTNEQKPDNELIVVCENTASNSSFSEDATYFTYPHMVSVLSCCLPSREMATLQWDPGIGTPSSINLCLPVFDVDDDKTDGCLSVFVDVFASIPEQQIYEEDKDVEAVYQVFEIRLPTSKSSIIGDPKDTVAISCCIMSISTCFSALRFVDLLLHYFQGNGVENRETVQWDPGIGTLSPIYIWLQGLTSRMATKNPVSSLQTPEPPTWQRQVATGPKQWSFCCIAMHYCQIFQRCTTVSSPFDCQGIALWLITFNPP